MSFDVFKTDECSHPDVSEVLHAEIVEIVAGACSREPESPVWLHEKLVIEDFLRFHHVIVHAVHTEDVIEIRPRVIHEHLAFVDWHFEFEIVFHARRIHNRIAERAAFPDTRPVAARAQLVRVVVLPHRITGTVIDQKIRVGLIGAHISRFALVYNKTQHRYY